MPNAPSSSSCFRPARRLTLAVLLAAAAIPAASSGRAAAETRPTRDAGGMRPATLPALAPAAPAPGVDDDNGHDKGGGGAGDATAAAAAAAEWLRVQNFIAAKSPNKWQMYKNLPDGGDLKPQLSQQLVQRYQALQRMKDNDPERHALEERAIGIEDEIYGILRDLDTATRQGQDPASDEARLRAKVIELVRNRDQWKARRLERVARELRSMNGGGHLAGAVKEVDAEVKRLLSLEPEPRRVDNRVKDFKQLMTGTKTRQPLGRLLPGAGSRPAARPVHAEPPVAPPPAAPPAP